MQAAIERQKQQPAIDQDTLLATDPASDVMHRPVTLRGLWLAPQTVYLDNRQMHGVPGFYVLTPLALEDSKQTVMVQRGWVQRNFNDRNQLGAVETPPGLVEITGRIAPPPSHLLELGKPAAATAAPSPGPAAGPAGGGTETATPALPRDGLVGSSPIRQNLDLAAFRTETGLPLRTDVSIQETGQASQGLQRDWPAPALGVEKHYGYAFQWFGLAALVIVLYVWFQLIAPFRRRRHARRA